MKRWALRILFCVLLGAVTTVAVAWTCALWPDPDDFIFSVLGRTDDNRYRSYQRWERWDSRYGTYLAIRPGAYECTQSPFTLSTSLIEHLDPEIFAHHLPRWSVFHAGDPLARFEEDLDDRAFHTFYEFASGWPKLALRLQCLRSTIWVDDNDDSPVESFPYRKGLFITPLKDEYGVNKRLPWWPVWSGFAVNASLFGSVWFVVLFLPGGARSVIRRMRGRCPRYGYDLRGSRRAASPSSPESTPLQVGCPECGWNRRE